MIAPRSEGLPEGLREAVRRNLAPVTPLAPPWQRTLAVGLPTLAALVWVLRLISGSEMSAPLLTFSAAGVALLEGLAGLTLVWLALREAVPAMGLGAPRATLALLVALLLQVGLGLLLWYSSGSGYSTPDSVEMGARCATVVVLIGIPHLALAMWLAHCAFPIRPRSSGALAGAAAGLLAAAVWHLACARHDFEHLLLWHFGATVAMAVLGGAVGSFLGRRLAVFR